MSSGDDIAIKVSHVSKDFVLPHEKIDSVKTLFVNPFKAKDAKKSEIQHALKGINFEVKKGEFFGIVGRNGSGKSTLLKIIAGIYQPSKGSVTVNGRLVPFIELGVGFNPELTGRENVYLNGALMGFSDAEIDKKYESIVEFAELSRFMDQKLKNYSSGMQVRLAFSVSTMLADADILLIDEVLAVGDADFQRKCYKYFYSLKKKGRSVVFISHDMEAIERFCDRVVMIDSSELVAEGEASEVAKKYHGLFSPTQVDDTTGKERAGNGYVHYTSARVDVDEREITISAEATITQSIDNPILGFSINAFDQKIIGTNTKIEHQKLKRLPEGYTLKIQWKLPNILSSNTYSFDLTAHSNDLTEVYDWWDEADEFTVQRERNLPYYNIDIPISFNTIS